MDEYLNKVIELITESTGLEKEEVSHDSFFEADLNMGQMELVDLLTDLEEIYQIDDLVTEQQEIEKVQDIVDLLVEKVE